MAHLKTSGYGKCLFSFNEEKEEKKIRFHFKIHISYINPGKNDGISILCCCFFYLAGNKLIMDKMQNSFIWLNNFFNNMIWFHLI